MLTPWQLKTWGLAQAGNRAGKTGLYLQWWDCGAEQQALASAVQKLCNSSPLLFLPSVALGLLSQALKLRKTCSSCWLLAAVDNWVVEVQWRPVCLP